MNLEQHFHSFFEQFETKKPLLALSGGPDSMALFYLLLSKGIAFEVAHVDHGWRSSSSSEALELAQLAQKNNIPFHLKVLGLSGSNLEDRCRKERLEFFSTLSHDVVLGHHADDQAETVLKRVFEGARLTKLKGLSPISQIGELRLLRPLLNVQKKEILAWLDQEKITYFVDETNSDTRYLRSRMRKEILPSLSKSFGKRIEPSLCRIGKLASELDEFADQLVKDVPTEGVIDLSKKMVKSAFEWRVIVSYIFEKQNLTLSSFHLDQIIAHLRKKSAHKMLRIKNQYVTIHRQTLEIKKV